VPRGAWHQQQHHHQQQQPKAQAVSGHGTKSVKSLDQYGAIVGFVARS